MERTIVSGGGGCGGRGSDGCSGWATSSIP